MVPVMVRKSRDLYQTEAVLGANHIDECCFPLSNVPSHVSLILGREEKDILQM